ncbi:hypothetical protein D3C85_1273200 [compost metagenome]
MALDIEKGSPTYNNQSSYHREYNRKLDTGFIKDFIGVNHQISVDIEYAASTITDVNHQPNNTVGKNPKNDKYEEEERQSSQPYCEIYLLISDDY